MNNNIVNDTIILSLNTGDGGFGCLSSMGNVGEEVVELRAMEYLRQDSTVETPESLVIMANHCDREYLCLAVRYAGEDYFMELKRHILLPAASLGVMVIDLYVEASE